MFELNACKTLVLGQVHEPIYLVGTQPLGLVDEQHRDMMVEAIAELAPAAQQALVGFEVEQGLLALRTDQRLEECTR